MLDAWHDVRAMWPHATSGTDASERFGPAVHRCWAILWPGRKDSQLKSMFENESTADVTGAPRGIVEAFWS